jgi:hypothetical protein
VTPTNYKEIVDRALEREQEERLAESREGDYAPDYIRLSRAMFIAADADFDLDEVIGEDTDAVRGWLTNIVRLTMMSEMKDDPRAKDPVEILARLLMQGITVGYAMHLLDELGEGE